MDSTKPMCWHIIGVNLATLEMQQEVVNENLLIPMSLCVSLDLNPPKDVTHCALVNTTDIESELHRKTFGAMTSARLAGVILVAF